MMKKEEHLAMIKYFVKFLNFFGSLTTIFFILFAVVSRGNAQCTVVANAGADKIVCQGGNTTLTASGSGGTAPYYYRWSSSTSGLNYAYYTGVWSTIPTFTSLTPASTGTVNNFDISGVGGSDYFAVKFWGNINISTAGTYTFYTSSDDGSKLYIDGTLVVNNDGIHTSQERSGTKALTAGLHFIEVQYFDRWGVFDVLDVKYAGPSISKQLIPNGVLSTAGTISSSNTVYPSTTGTYTVTVTDSKGCTATDDMTITVPGATANAGTDIYQCNNSTFTLGATTPSIGSGTWSVISGIGTIATPTSPTSSVTGVPAGSAVNLKWTITASGCPANDTVVVVNNLATSPACSCGSVFSVTGTTTSFADNQIRPLNISTGQYGSQFGSNLSVGTAAIAWDTLNKRFYYVDFNASTLSPTVYSMNSLGVSTSTGVSLPGFSVAENYNRAGYNAVTQKTYFISSAGTSWACYEPGSDGLGGTVATLSPVTYYPSTAPQISSTNGGGDLVFDYKGNGYVVTNAGQFYKAFFNANGSVSVVYLGKLTLPMNQIAALAFGTDDRLYVSGTSNSGSGFNPKSDVYYIDLETLVTTQVNSSKSSSTTDYTSCNFPFYDPQLVPTKTYTKISGFPSTSITAGDVIEYRISVVNSGNISAGNVKLFDTIPTNTTYVLNSTKINGTTVPDVSSKTRFAVAGGDFINSTAQTLYNGVISPGDSAVITFRVRITTCATVSNVAKITSGYFNEEAQSNIVSFEAVSLPAPLITSIESSCTSNDNMIISGSNVSLIATGGTSYAWSGGLGSAPTITVSPSTTTTYTVTVTSPAGCVSATSKTIFVVDAPSETVSATENSCSPNDDKVLSGGGVNLVASASSGTSVYFSIIASHSSKNIEVSGSSTAIGAGIVQRTATGGANQRWVFISTTTGKPVSTITDGRYYIQNINSKLFLYPRSAGSTEGTVVEQSVVWGTSTQWDVTSVGSGQFKIINVSNSLGLEIASSSMADAAVLQLAAYIGSTNQIFNLTSNNGYIYTWNNSLGSGATKSPTPASTTTYIATVTDVMGCTATANKSITVVAAPTISIAATESSCSANDNNILNGSSVTLTASGGTSYVWSTGETTAAITKTPSSTTTYTVTATDANGCTNTASKTITIVTSPTVNITSTESSCVTDDDIIISGGSANLTALGSGGGGSFSYNWSGGLTTGAGPKTVSPISTTIYTVTATDANGCTAIANKTITVVTSGAVSIASTESSCTSNDDKVLSGSIVSLIASGSSSYAWDNGLGTGASKSVTPTSTTTYTVTATDGNGCISTASKTITVIANPTVNISATENSCTTSDDKILNGASVSLTASGGSTYTWDNSLGTGAGKIVTPSVLTTYSVTATDANGCTGTATKTITIVTSPTASITATESSCTTNDDKIITGATVNLVASGGSTYAWNNSLGSGATKTPTPAATTTYTVTATDANGCTATASKMITVTAGLNVSNTPTNILCNGASTGAISLSASGGATPYTYNWSDGNTTQNRTGLVAGAYSVTVTDASGCSQNSTITLTEPAALSIATTPTNINCFGLTTGAISIAVSGGALPYSYNWGSGVTTQNRTGLAAGTYTVTVMDANSCTKTATVTLTQPAAALSLSTSVTNIICGTGTGAINLTVSGGTTSYIYDWGGGVTTEDRTGLTSGTYTVTVTDGNSCTASTSSTVTVTTAASLLTSVTNISCFGVNTGAINLTASGGAPYTYNWGGGVTTEDRTGLAAGTYTVTVTNTHGCTSTTSATVTTPSVLALSSNNTDVICSGGSTGAIDITVTGGTTPYTYDWGGGITTEDRTGLTAGNYSVTVTDANSCTAILAVTITQPTALNLSTVLTQVTCVGGTDGAIDLTVTGGTTPYAYNWGSGITTQDRTSLGAGTYSVTVTDFNGCTATTSATLTPQNNAPNPPTGLKH